MNVIINGENKTLSPSLTLDEALAQFNLPPKSYVVELNGKIISQDSHNETLKDGDRVEVIRFVGGG